VRARVPATQQAAFLGTHDADADYPGVLVLLATITTLPELGARLIAQLATLEPGTDLPAVGVFLGDCFSPQELDTPPGVALRRAFGLLADDYSLDRLRRWGGTVGRFSFEPLSHIAQGTTTAAPVKRPARRSSRARAASSSE
jgi:hypothetical protein